MDFTNLKTLVVSVECGSFSKAAEILCVTQSAVSRRIKILEDHYGQLLLDRSGLAMKPTAAGQLLVEKARQVLKMEQEFLYELQLLARKRKISFCCTAPFGISFLPDIFTRFMSRNSQTSELSFVFDMPEGALKGVREKLYDLVLIEFCEDLNLEDFAVYALPDDEMVFVSRPAFGIDAKVVDVETMLGQRLYCKKSGCCARRFLEKSMHVIGRDAAEFRNTVYFDDIPFIIKAVQAGEGITFISRSVVAAHLADGSLVSHQVRGFAPSRPRRLVLEKNRNLDPTLSDLIEEIFHRFSLAPPPELVSR
ncbi:LysR family transcriptional regulator [Geomonas sp. Red69]|uniref:LysR family transcriptional regulator n=1 Tax=Geomonas diazotrophica TaxID=2843197 RepID=A0ABX8JH68_9BACT|nr:MULTISPECIES: LysR family transcriptional regulator [Geomonas]MBU5638433.1 LysR family transcriptional regulator [Geomonas diazotrophica]QWV97341.1 LysR family transcriptional regulator [Geomonas nitrogeniifigens]QXE86498.1 LysR family transcriptional regulator [Geomonas nitrogeniifigens]